MSKWATFCLFGALGLVMQLPWVMVVSNVITSSWAGYAIFPVRHEHPAAWALVAIYAVIGIILLLKVRDGVLAEERAARARAKQRAREALYERFERKS